ncbi:hypothetical protein AOLI_G00267100 [Acnodon oligacanthus]
MSKEPWYVHCLKPNKGKHPGHLDDVFVRHQVKYLGLMEHLRLAGFTYRRTYELFLKRFCSSLLFYRGWTHPGK